MRFSILVAGLLAAAALPVQAADAPLRIATFEADVTPPLGTPLCDALVHAGQGNRRSAQRPRRRPLRRREADRALRRRLGRHRQQRLRRLPRGPRQGGRHHAAIASPSTACTSTTRPAATSRPTSCSRLHGLGGKLFDPAFARKAIERVADAVEKAAGEARDRHPPRHRQGEGRASRLQPPRAWAPTAR